MKVWQDAFFLWYYRFRIYSAQSPKDDFFAPTFTVGGERLDILKKSVLGVLSPIDDFFAPDFKVGGGSESLKKSVFWALSPIDHFFA